MAHSLDLEQFGVADAGGDIPSAATGTSVSCVPWTTRVGTAVITAGGEPFAAADGTMRAVPRVPRP